MQHSGWILPWCICFQSCTASVLPRLTANTKAVQRTGHQSLKPMAKHIACVLWALTAIAAAFAPPTRTNACARASVVRPPPAPSTDGSRHVAIRASDDDEAEPFFADPPPAPATNDDRIVAYVAVGSTLVFFGLYAYETLRLMAEGEFYMPHF